MLVWWETPSGSPPTQGVTLDNIWTIWFLSILQLIDFMSLCGRLNARNIVENTTGAKCKRKERGLESYKCVRPLQEKGKGISPRSRLNCYKLTFLGEEKGERGRKWNNGTCLFIASEDRAGSNGTCSLEPAKPEQNHILKSMWHRYGSSAAIPGHKFWTQNLPVQGSANIGSLLEANVKAKGTEPQKQVLQVQLVYSERQSKHHVAQY